MFEDSLLESARHISRQRGWMTLLSTSIQIVLMALLVILPLLRTSAISPQTNRITVVAPYAGEPRSSGSPPPSEKADSENITPIQVAPVSQITNEWTKKPDPVQTSAPDVCVMGCGGNGSSSGVPYAIGSSPPPVVLKQPARPPIISRLNPGQIIRRVEPLYPPLARTARIQGEVVLRAIISRDGVIERLQVVRSGHPMLDRAALEAVSQWRFRPYVLNGQPIEIETEVTVNFILAR